jgi:RecA-family ATPase
MSKGIFETLANIEPRNVGWFWEPFIPYRMTTIMEGDPGVGKSYAAMHIAAKASIGGRLPGQRLEQQRVLYFSAEDDPAYTIRPRIDAMGGDARRIRFQAKYSPFDDTGLKQAWKEVRSTRPDLIIIDPLYGFVPSEAEMYKPNEIRSLLAKINELAEYCDAAVLVIRHLTKAKRDKAIYQGVGSIDVIAVARSAILVAEHPEDPDLKVLAHVKHNISAKGDSLAFQLVKREQQLPVLRWRGKVELSAEDLLTFRKDHAPARNAAEEFLETELEKGPKLAEEVLSAAEKRGFRKRTLDRAKAAIGVETRKSGAKWVWSLPEEE